ncbi:hypothetical protein FGRMN_8488 [Fusarium graminum]|nr:hypothetical protein FGRMN_8488 [Fusarium graminum]
MSGLEILGAIASSIALAQAVQGTLKAIDFLRQNSEMKKGCNSLRKEILMIEYFISQAREQTSPTMPAQRLLGISSEHPLVSLTTLELEEILEELTKIVEKYSRSRKVHDPKRYTDKMKWFSEASKIEELRQRAQTIKSDLHMAIAFRVSSMVDRGNMRQEVLSYRVTQQLTYHTQDIPQNWPQLTKVSHSMTEEGVAEMSSLSLTDNVGPGTTTIKEESLQIVRTVRPLGLRRCANCYDLLPRGIFDIARPGSALDKALGKAMEFVNDWDEVSMTKVHVAAAEGELLSALKEQPWAINQLCEEDWAPIHNAVFYDNFEGIEQLIRAGADVNQTTSTGQTPLMIVQHHKNEVAAQKLLENHECRRLINKGCPEGMTALHYAIQKMSPECVGLLLEAGASTSKITKEGYNCMHILADSDEQDQQAVDEVFHLLQVRGVDLEARDELGNTPLMTAILSGNIIVLKALLSAGASIDAINSRRQNVLWFAARSRDFRVVDCLAEQDLKNLDPQLLDSQVKVTALGRLTWILEEGYDVVSQETPTPDQQQAFIALYFNLLIRDLRRLTDILIEIRSAAEMRDSATVAALLDVLVKKNKASFRHEHAAWYRGLQTYVKNGNWEHLVEAISEEQTETLGKISRASDAKGKTIREPEMHEFYRVQGLDN